MAKTVKTFREAKIVLFLTAFFFLISCTNSYTNDGGSSTTSSVISEDTILEVNNTKDSSTFKDRSVDVTYSNSGSLSLKNDIITYIESQPKFTHSNYGLKAVNLSTGKTIVSINSNKVLTPASNAKVFTTIAGLDILGENYKFKTTVGYKGNISNGVLNGDLYVIGGGDPTLGSKYLNGEKVNNNQQLKFLNTWVDEVKKANIRKVNGKIIVDVSHFGQFPAPVRTWEWLDMAYSYGGIPGSINILDNTLFVKLDYGPSTSHPLNIPSITLKNNLVKTSDRSDITMVVPPFGSEILAYGKIRAPFTKKIAMANPPLVTGELFKKYLKKSGISVGSVEVRDSSVEVTPLKVTYSPPLKEIIKYMNKDSINLYAESIKMESELTLKENGSGYSNIVKYLTAKYGLNGGDSLYDGSGLSRYSRLTPDSIMTLLLKNHKAVFTDSLAISGVDGTLKGIKSPFLQENFIGKTGTLTGIKAYSGYMKNKFGDTIAISMIINGHSGRSKDAQKVLEDVFLKIVEE